MPDQNNPTAVADAQLTGIAAFEAALHGQPADVWAAFRDMARTAVAMPALAEERATRIADLAADATKPGDYRRAETARMQAAAEAELTALHGQATVAAAALEGRLRGRLVPQVDPNPAARALHREELRAALEAAPMGQRLQAAERLLTTASPAVVAELASDYGRVLMGNAADTFSQVLIGGMRRRGGFDAASRAAAATLGAFEAQRIRGRVDGLYQMAKLKLRRQA